MCDIYDHTCIVCGESIGMHLGDYLTERNEVAVFHKECYKEVMREHKAEEGDVVVIMLTENALANIKQNGPNS